MNALSDPSPRTAVFVTSLRKAYGEKVVLDDVDLSIGEGEVFALLAGFDREAMPPSREECNPPRTRASST